MKKHGYLLIAPYLLIIMMVISGIIVYAFVSDRKSIAVEKAFYMSESSVSELERSLSYYMQATDTLRILIVDGDGKINDFNKVAHELYHNDKAFRSIQLAPGGNVQYVYPLEGNEDAFGDLFSDPDRRTEAEYARDTGQTTLAGPFELYQSGMGIVVRQPIYLGEGEDQEFWGFAIVVLNVPEIFDSANLDSLTNMGYEYKLWRTQPDSGEKQMILQSSEQELDSPVSRQFEVPGNIWTLDISLQGGWIDYGLLVPIVLALMCISILLPALCYALVKINEQRKEILETANHDYLTQLYNGRKMSLVLEKLGQGGKTFLLVYMDVNQFKYVNDTYGHVMGDELLKEIARRIRNVLKENDYAFRIGGDEFVLIVQDQNRAADWQVSLMREVSAGLKLGGQDYYPQVSIGCAAYPQEADSVEELIQLADKRMYEMKHQG